MIYKVRAGSGSTASLWQCVRTPDSEAPPPRPAKLGALWMEPELVVAQVILVIAEI